MDFPSPQRAVLVTFFLLMAAVFIVSALWGLTLNMRFGTDGLLWPCPYVLVGAGLAILGRQYIAWAFFSVATVIVGWLAYTEHSYDPQTYFFHGAMVLLGAVSIIMWAISLCFSILEHK